MSFGEPKFFDASKAPERREKHERSALRTWLVEALSKMGVGQCMIVPGSEATTARGTLSLCARNAAKDLSQQTIFKRRQFEIYASDSGVVVSRTA